MGIFNPFISSCEHERNLDWILKRVKGMPQKEEMESALEEARGIAKRADGLVAQVESVIKDATAAAKDDIRRDLSESIGRIEEAERNTLAKATEIQTVINNATYNAKLELSNYVNAQLTEIRTLAESVSEDSGYVEQVVTDAASALKNQIIDDIDSRYSELSSKITRDIETAKNALTAENTTNFNNHKTALTQHIESELSTAKTDLNNTIVDDFNAKKTELETHVDNYVPNAVAQSVNERFKTCGVFVPVGAWSGKTARVDAGMNVDTTTLFVTYSPSSFDDWYDNGVRCVGAEGTYLLFECAFVPARELYVYVVAVENIVYGG